MFVLVNQVVYSQAGSGLSHKYWTRLERLERGTHYCSFCGKSVTSRKSFITLTAGKPMQGKMTEGIVHSTVDLLLLASLVKLG